MKTILRPLLPLLALAAALPVLGQADETTSSKPPKPATKAMRLMGSHAGEPRKIETEPATFLGVTTERVTGTLTSQLGLSPGMGLVVGGILPESPAATVLKRDDILVKLNDQLLINSHQLAVLVRSFKEGDEVTLTYVRAGKEATTKVKLAKRDVPKLSLLDEELGPRVHAWGFATPEAGASPIPFDHLRHLDELPRGEVDRLLETFEAGRALPGSAAVHSYIGGASPVARVTAIGQGNIAFTDDQGSLEIRIEDGSRLLTAKDPGGNVLFDGPINTPEEKAAMPEAVRKRFEQLEVGDRFWFRTDDDFEGGEVNVVVPRAKPIALPGPTPSPAPVPRIL